MKIEIEMTPEMSRYVQLQRTGIKGNIIDKYSASCVEDFESILKFLPKNCNKILDIGSGMGGIDLILSAYYNHNVELHLLDYNKCDSNIYYGYRKITSAYSSLLLSSEFLKINGVNKQNIGIHDASKNQKIIKADIILSLISCGFHYPVKTYIEYIKKCKNGIVILDIRKNSDQINYLIDNFKSIEIAKEYEKYLRVCIK